MQKSTAVAARAIVMLVCLVGIPLVALSGSSLPELAAKLIEGRSVPETDHSRDSLSEAPAFEPSGASTSAAAPPVFAGGGVAPANVGASSTSNVPVGYEVPSVSPGGTAGGPPCASSPTAGQPSQGGLSGLLVEGQPTTQPDMPTMFPGSGAAVQGAARQPPLGGADQVPAGPGSIGGGTGQSSQDGGTFVRVQERLRDMGAVYYRLESWGAQSQLYRFQCEMAVESSRGLTRHFEAVDNHPLVAMQRVLAEAETWHASR
jgi:hypothetical protein